MPTKPLLDIMIATHGQDGLDKVAAMQLPSIPGIRYIVSCQNPRIDIHQALQRNDIAVFFTDSRGVSANRNNLLRLSDAPWALVADDDLSYDKDGLTKLLQRLNEGTDADIITVKHTAQGKRKIYPADDHNLDIPYKGYYVTAFEIVMRMETVRRVGLQFCEDISIGTPYFTCGEEQVFMTNARRLGLKREFWPIHICRHIGLTTGLRDACKPGVLHSQGMILLLDYPWTLLPRLVLKAKRSGGFFPITFYHLLAGAIRALFLRKKLLSTNKGFRI